MTSLGRSFARLHSVSKNVGWVGGVILEARVRSIISEMTTTIMDDGWMMVDTVVLASLLDC